jgi:hypothetical protein
MMTGCKGFQINSFYLKGLKLILVESILGVSRGSAPQKSALAVECCPIKFSRANIFSFKWNLFQQVRKTAIV